MSVITKEVKELTSKIDFSQLKNKSVLITGASGLVGVYMVACLKAVCKQYNIKIYTWFKSKIEPEFVDIFDGCEIIKSDITESSNFNELPMFDCIIHAAGYGQPGKFLEDKIKTITLNTTSTINLFNKLNKGGKFLFISTSELYSGLDSSNISETEIGTTNTDHPRACYIEGKRCGETICYSYLGQGVDVKIARLSLAYGPGTKKNDHRVLNSLIQKGLTEDSIKLMDGGDAMRTYCYITDVIEMFWNILLFGKQTIYNVGGRSVTTILDLARLIGVNLDKQVILPDKIKEMAGNPKVVNIDLSTYINEFKKNNFIPLKDGIKETIKWQRQLYYDTSNA
jgi:nucleoside-diphosphate-sugar epimerase